MTYAKNARYRLKCISEGRCPHCGKPCAPYSVCASRRLYKKVMRMIRRMTEAGALIKVGNRYSRGSGANPYTYRTSDGDRRLLPRIGRKPADDAAVTSVCLDIIRERGGPMTETEIAAEYAKRVRTPTA